MLQSYSTIYWIKPLLDPVKQHSPTSLPPTQPSTQTSRAPRGNGGPTWSARLPTHGPSHSLEARTISRAWPIGMPLTAAVGTSPHHTRPPCRVASHDYQL